MWAERPEAHVLSAELLSRTRWARAAPRGQNREARSPRRRRGELRTEAAPPPFRAPRPAPPGRAEPSGPDPPLCRSAAPRPARTARPAPAQGRSLKGGSSMAVTSSSEVRRARRSSSAFASRPELRWCPAPAKSSSETGFLAAVLRAGGAGRRLAGAPPRWTVPPNLRSVRRLRPAC